MSKNTLSSSDRFLLFNWAEDNRERLMKTTFAGAAQEASELLGRFVTVGNIESIFRSRGFPKKKTPRPVKPEPQPEMTESAQIRRLERRTALILQALDELNTELVGSSQAPWNAIRTEAENDRLFNKSQLSLTLQ